MKHLLLYLSLFLFMPLFPSENERYTFDDSASGRYKLMSPNKKLALKIEQTEAGHFVYSFTANNKMLIGNSTLGFTVANNHTIPSSGWIVKNVSRVEIRDIWKPIWGKRSVVDDHYNELTLELCNADSDHLSQMQIVARAYDDGIAFKYVISYSEDKTVDIVSEKTEYNFVNDYTAWFYNGEYHNIGPELLSQCDGRRLPVMTVRADTDSYMAIHEANLIEGEPLTLQTVKGETRFTISSKSKRLYPGYNSAWRVILYGSTPGSLTDSHTIELLNPEPSTQYDFSWVKPGLAMWDWRMDGAVVDDFEYKMSYPSWERAVDFAAKQNVSYLVLDANWYGPEFETDSDPLVGDKAKDVQKLIGYGKQKGVGIWLYLNDVGGKKFPIEETLKQYGEWGAVGVKYGFMSGSQEEKNYWTQTVTRLCAENHLLVDYHDNPVHPYGQMRTWPNAVTREYCHAQLDARRVFEPKTLVTTVFVNMVAGPLDMNNGMFDLRQGNTTRTDCNLAVPSTLVSEAARTLIIFSGVTILPDIPEFYQKHPALLNFISEQQMPWVESKTLAGEIGEYIVMMRQTKEAILVGAATNELARKLDISLSFLGEGKYEAEIIQDGADAHYLTNRESYMADKRIVTKKDSVNLSLAAGGGACMTFKSIP